MAIQHANVGIIKNNLQLYYNREYNGSFLGESTVNFFSIPAATLQKEGNHSTSFVTSTSSGIPDLVVPGNKQVYYVPEYYTLVATGAWQGEVNRLIIYPKYAGGNTSYAPNGTYRVSFYARSISGNTALGYAFYSNSINNTANLTTKWQRFSANSTYSNGAMILEFGNLNAGAMVCQIACIQIEAKSYATPFTLPVLWTPNITNVTSTSGNTIMTKGTPGNGWTNARVYSSEGYNEPCYVSFKASQTTGAIMIALNSDPGTGIDYSYLDYAFYIDNSGYTAIYESGANPIVFGNSTYTTSTIFEIIYDGVNINYYMDGVLKRTIARSGTGPLYLDSSFWSNSSAINSLSFGKLSQINRFSNYVIGGGGLYDLSKNNNNADLNNMSFNSTGYIFSGSQYITVPYSSNLDRNDFTIMGYCRTPTNDNSHDTIVSRNSDVYGTNGNGWNISRLRNGLSLANCFRFMIYGDSTTASEVQGPAIADNVWRHFAVVVDKSVSNTAVIYINGVLYSTLSSLPVGNHYPSSGSPPMYIGCNKANSDLWNGDIAQILYYAKTLTAAEVLQNFNATRTTYGL